VVVVATGTAARKRVGRRRARRFNALALNLHHLLLGDDACCAYSADGDGLHGGTSTGWSDGWIEEKGALSEKVEEGGSARGVLRRCVVSREAAGERESAEGCRVPREKVDWRTVESTRGRSERREERAQVSKGGAARLD